MAIGLKGSVVDLAQQTTVALVFRALLTSTIVVEVNARDITCTFRFPKY